MELRVVVVGATGNVGTSLVRALGAAPEVESVLGLARRKPRLSVPKTEWAEADIRRDDLVPHFVGADAVVHLAWSIQPSHDLEALWRTNVHGSGRVFQAVVDASVPALVHASSVGAYSPGPKNRTVDETWPTDGIRTSFYSRHKAEVERLLDRLERESPGLRVVRLRPGLTFKREAASGIRRLFAGPFLPSPLLSPSLVPVVPSVRGLRIQGVHSDDVAEAYRLAVTGDARGAFNIAAEPVLDSRELARLLRARLAPLSRGVLRPLVTVSWKLRLQPTPPGWLDLALAVPLLDTTRARTQLGWSPKRRADEAFLELLAGMRAGEGAATPPLSPRTSGRLRAREFLTRVGGRE